MDLLVSVPVDMPGAGRPIPGGRGPASWRLRTWPLLAKGSLEIPLVQDGVVVSPVTARNVPTMTSSLMKARAPATMPVEEIVIAVAPEEVAPLDEAMDLKHEITCVARSGLPESAPALPCSGRPATGGRNAQVLAALARHFWAKTARPPGQGSPALERRKPATHEERNARQGSGGNGHHARLEPHGRRPFHGGDDRNETAIRALQRTGEQPCRGTARRRIGQASAGGQHTASAAEESEQ